MKDSHLLISTVGKRLVHYKHLIPGAKRAKISLVSIKTLVEYLGKNRAVLVQKGSALPEAVASRRA